MEQNLKPKPPQKPKKHEPVLLPQNPQNKPVKNPWIWLTLLGFAVLTLIWKSVTYDEAATKAHYQKMAETVQNHKEAEKQQQILEREEMLRKAAQRRKLGKKDPAFSEGK